MGKFPRRRKYTNRVGKLKEFVENRCEFGGTGFKYYSKQFINSLFLFSRQFAVPTFLLNLNDAALMVQTVL